MKYNKLGDIAVQIIPLLIYLPLLKSNWYLRQIIASQKQVSLQIFTASIKVQYSTSEKIHYYFMYIIFSIIWYSFTESEKLFLLLLKQMLYYALCLSYPFNTEVFCLHIFRQAGPLQRVDCLAPPSGKQH